MALFQQSVLKKYLGGMDKAAVQKSWDLFTSHFHNPVIQENILNSKEEVYQDGFVIDLFVKVLGYTLNPQPDYNFVLEMKTATDSTKSDGAILNGDAVIAVVELKDTSTTDLDKVEKQAFGYKHRHKDCTYIITSNFQKLRFYINDATAHEEFDLFILTREQFDLLYLCLQKDNILKNIPLKVKQESITRDEQVTKKLYADYSAFRQKLFHNIVKHNPQYDKIALFKRTQKLLDRFLFILFAEDRLLVPANSVRILLDDWKHLKELDAAQPLYHRFKLYFGFLNTGRAASQKKEEIFAYNGGLFEQDPILDNLLIDDNILFESSVALSNYDYQTEVDVNILGHIFEHSLSEIEELQAEAEGRALDKTKTKRKKDGVFYTPRYITKYIVENTVGSLCKQKKEELQLHEEDYAPLLKKKNQQQLLDKLNNYRNWLLQLTICDPACGSGAFLNQALEFLIAEHRYIDELDAKLGGHSIVYSDVEKSILENNLYGVDINEEAVEIARLSLWLRTAQKGRKLSSLNENIKCGNSLIDDPVVAGEKAFNWEKEFASVFNNGGFDVVIGNPPWGAKLDSDIVKILADRFPLVPSKLKDTYLYFMLISLGIIKKEGFFGLIVPNTWLLINNTSDFRKHFLELDIIGIIDHGDNVFEDAIVESSTLILKNKVEINGTVRAVKYRNGDEIVNHEIDKNIWLGDALHRIVLELKQDTHSIIKKIEGLTDLFEKTSEIIFGIKPYQVGYGIPPQSQEMVDKRIYHSNKKLADGWYPLVTGTDVTRYSLFFAGNEYIHYGKWLMYPSNEKKIKSPKILLRRTSHDLKAAYDNEFFYPQNSLFIITSDLELKYLTCLLNSKLFDFIYKGKCPQVGKVFAEVKPSIVKSLPIAKIQKNDQLPFIAQADIMLSTNQELHELKQKFLQLLQSNFPSLQTNKKLEQWSSLSFAEFLKELSKQKIKLSLAQQEEWMGYFEEQKSKAASLQNTLDTTDKEIDLKVYQLYGLTEEEIAIVEGR